MPASIAVSELFLSIDDFLSRGLNLAEKLDVLDGHISCLAAQGFYCLEEDHSLIVLVIDQQTPRTIVEQVSNLLHDLSIDCFELSALSIPERDHFHQIELPRYQVQAHSANSAAGAVTELHKQINKRQHQGPVGWASGTPTSRDLAVTSFGAYSQVRRRRSKTSGTKKRRSRQKNRTTRAGHGPQSGMLKPFAEKALLAKEEQLLAKEEQLLTKEEQLWAKKRVTEETVPSKPRAKPNIQSATRKKGRTRPLRPPTRSQHFVSDSSTPNLGSSSRQYRITANEVPILRIRFLRGERWLPGRVRYVSNREVRIATGAPMRLGDLAIVALSFQTEELFITGTISHVEVVDSNAQPSPKLSPGFSVKFHELSSKKISHLVSLLRRARDAGVSLTPPPIRGAPRFPVSWPVVVRNHTQVEVRTDRVLALDISGSGLYLDVEAKTDSELMIAIPLDNSEQPIRCRGQVVRVVTHYAAQAFQTVAGAGVMLTHFGSQDAERYKNFLDRIEYRCQRRIVVAASEARAPALTQALSSAGYAVTSSTNPQALVELADREPRPPDVAVIDDSLKNMLESEMLCSLFKRRNVPCLSTHGEGSMTRQAIDCMLDVYAA